MATGGATVVDMSPPTRLIQVITNPKDFFQTIKDEAGTDALKMFFLMFIYAPAIVNWVMSIVTLQVVLKQSVVLANTIPGLMNALITTPLITLVAVYVTHFFIKLLGGKDDLLLTAKCIVYTSGITSTATATLAVLSIALTLAGQGLLAILLTLGWIVLALYTLIISLWGFEILHEMGMGKALVAVILAGIVSFLAWGVVGLAFGMVAGMLGLGGAVVTGG
jgi:hypothetical protein